MDDETRERLEALEREVSRLRQLLAGPPASSPRNGSAANGDSGPVRPVWVDGDRVWVTASEDPVQVHRDTLALLAKDELTWPHIPDDPAAG